MGGPDISGKTSQINALIEILKSKGRIVRDLRGGEIEALFHAEIFQEINQNYSSFKEYISSENKDYKIFAIMFNIIEGSGGTNQDLKFASMIKNNCSTYINPDSADVWIMEEPTKRGAGLENRFIEQHRSQWGSEMNPIAAAYNHQSYRTEEFLRFRKPLREAGKIILRSRSEESAPYQIYDKRYLPNGIKLKDYLTLPGHQIAFANPPTHIFIVCGPKNWTKKAYIELISQRSNGRAFDDHETNAEYQILINRRYATDWLEKLYEQGCKMYNAKFPKIERFNIYDTKEKILSQMKERLEKILC